MKKTLAIIAAVAVFVLMIFLVVSCNAERPNVQPETTPQGDLPIKEPAQTSPSEAIATAPPTVETQCEETISQEEENEATPVETSTQETSIDQRPKETEPKPSTDPIEDKPNETVPVEPPATEAIPEETDPEETTPVETVPPETEPAETTSQETEPAETAPTECQHDWMLVRHEEEGHWIAGIMCDCGWTVYGEASTLSELWVAHIASYPPEEAFFEHGGYGSVDEWVVDKPAYEEWVCRNCGERKE